MQLAEMSWEAVEGLSRDLPVAIPVAAVEQHGRHLPLFTDSMLLGEVVRRTAEKMHDQVLFAPLMWLGNSHHHMDFPGTLSASPRLYLDLLVNLLDNFLHHGFRRLAFVNGHGGNIVPCQQAVFEVRQQRRDRGDLLLLAAAYWQLGPVDPASSGSPSNGPSGDWVQTRMGHACEWETSMMLRLAPHLVGDLGRTQPVTQAMPFDPAAQGWTTKDRSEVGHIGVPSAASADKGEALFQRFTGDLCTFLERVAAWPTA